MMTLKYPDNQRIIDRLRTEVEDACGAGAWAEVTRGVAPTGDMEGRELSACMQPMLERLEDRCGQQAAQRILHHVKHALARKDYGWARTMFLEYGDIDRFADAVWKMQMKQLEDCAEKGEPFYGQPIDQAAYEYARSIPELFYGRRQGNRITAVAIPYQLMEYLRAEDGTQKRYWMCHCPFARESILGEKAVSKSMCHCSMGHVKLFWETALDTELEGEVVHSALQGDDRCEFAFFLPDGVIERYTE